MQTRKLFANSKIVCNDENCLQRRELFATTRIICNDKNCLQTRELFANSRIICNNKNYLQTRKSFTTIKIVNNLENRLQSRKSSTISKIVCIDRSRLFNFSFDTKKLLSTMIARNDYLQRLFYLISIIFYIICFSSKIVARNRVVDVVININTILFAIRVNIRLIRSYTTSSKFVVSLYIFCVQFIFAFFLFLLLIARIIDRCAIFKINEITTR